MTEQAGSPAGKTPLVQPGVKADTPRDSASGPQAAPEDPYGLAARLRAQAAAIEAAAAPPDEYTRLKVEPPHTSFAYGGTVVGPEWTAVHTSLVPGVLSAAAGTAGVTVTQEGA